MRYVVDVKSKLILDICWKKLFRKIGIDDFKNDDILSNYLYFEKGIYNDKSKTFMFKLEVFLPLEVDYPQLFEKLKKRLLNHPFIKYYNHSSNTFIVVIKDIDFEELLFYLNEFCIYNHHKLLRVENVKFYEKVNREYKLIWLDEKLNKKITIKYLHGSTMSIFYTYKNKGFYYDAFIELEKKDNETFQLCVGYKNTQIILKKISNNYFIKSINNTFEEEEEEILIDFKLPIKRKSFITKLENYISDFNKFTNEFLIKFIRDFDINEFIKKYKRIYKDIVNQINTFSLINTL